MTEKNDHDMIIELHAAVIGVNGQDGMARKLNNHIEECDEQIETLHNKANRTRNGLIALTSFLSGSGIIAGGTIAGLS